MRWVNIFNKFSKTYRQIAEDRSEWKFMKESFIEQLGESGQ